jgi:hypothetical protein
MVAGVSADIDELVAAAGAPGGRSGLSKGATT